MTIFGPDQLKAAIDAEFAAIPEGKRGALVGYYTTDGTWRVTVATRIGEHWQLGAVASKDKADGKIQGGFRVQATW